MKTYSYGSHHLDDDDKKAVLEALDEPLITQGRNVPLFEEKIAQKCESRFAVASNSGTSSLHAACLALGVKEGDIVWVPAISFVASANCAVYCGARVEFIDIGLGDFNLDLSVFKHRLEVAKRLGSLPKALIVVHMAGYAAEMQELYNLCLESDIRIIEDASHALGALYKEEPVGCCKYSDITVFSFHPVKMITTVEGGVATTNCPELYRKMKLFCNHGIQRDPDLFSQEPLGPVFYDQTHLGYNYRLNDVQAALGLSQIKKLEAFVGKRNEIAQHYSNALDRSFFMTPEYDRSRLCSYHLYVIRCVQKGLRDSVFEALKSEGINCNIHYIPIYRHGFYRDSGNYDVLDFPNAENYYESALSIPIHYRLDKNDQDFIVDRLNRVAGSFS